MPRETRNYKWGGKSYQVPSRDSQRQKVYRAEREAFPRADRELIDGGNLRSVISFVRSVEASETWRKIHELSGKAMPMDGLEVKDGRGRRNAWGSFFGICLPTWSRSKIITLHEMAHSATPGAQHNWPFAAAYLILVGRFLGAEARDRLKAAFKKHRVRSTPPRQMSSEHLAKLRAQGFRLAAAKKVLKTEAQGELDPSKLLAGDSLYVVRRPLGNNEPFGVHERRLSGAPRQTDISGKWIYEYQAGSVRHPGTIDLERTFLQQSKALEKAAELNRAISEKFLVESKQQEELAKAIRGDG